MSKTTELVERLRELPRDTRKATVEIYDLCIEASYEIEELTDRCARYAEEIAVLQEKQKWVDAGARQPECGVPVLAVASGKAGNITLCNAVVFATFCDGWGVGRLSAGGGRGREMVDAHSGEPGGGKRRHGA